MAASETPALGAAMTSDRKRGLPREPRRRLSALLYLLLFVITVALTLLSFFLRSQPWAETWLPNFVAEAWGVFVAVVVVDQLLLVERRRQDERAMEPLRSAAARSLGDACERLVNVMVWSYAAATESERESAEGAAEFADGWPTAVEEWSELSDPGWMRSLSETLAEVGQSLGDVLADYREALTAQEIVDLNELRAASRGGQLLGGASGSPDEGRRRERTLRVSTRVARALPSAIRIYERLSKSSMTTETGWATLPLGMQGLGLRERPARS